MEEIVCPKCHSNQISVGQKGFNSTGAALNMLVGNSAATSTAIGMVGSNKSIITCIKCGNKFQPGDGTIKTVDDKGVEIFKKQEFVDKDKERSMVVGIVLFFVLIIILIVFSQIGLL